MNYSPFDSSTAASDVSANIIGIEWDRAPSSYAHAHDTGYIPGAYTTAREYRQFMNNNQRKIHQANIAGMIRSSGNNPYAVTERIVAQQQTTINGNGDGNGNNGNNSNNGKYPTPFLFHSVHDTRTPYIGWNNTDLKQSYIAQTRLQSRTISVQIPAAKLDAQLN